MQYNKFCNDHTKIHARKSIRFNSGCARSRRPLTAGGSLSFPGPSRGRCSCSCSVQFFPEQRFAEELRDQQ